MEPEVIRSKEEMRGWSRACRSRGMTIGFVPTMGYLHEGHVALVREAQSVSDIVVVSIYVNPAQFAPSEDLSTYPSDFAADLRKLAGLAAAVFSPADVYDRRNTVSDGINGGTVSCLEESGSGHESWVRVERLEKGLCGLTRPVFFRGVATIVAKLLNIVEPDVAVFGKKDYQQFKIVTKMVCDLDFPVRIVGSEIVRDSDGLAMSSRNVRLSPEERNQALSINRSLSRAKSAAEKDGRAKCRELRDSVAEAITKAGGRVDYAEIVDQESLDAVEEIKSPAVFCVAAWFGNVRLLDNMEINPPLSHAMEWKGLKQGVGILF